MGWVLAIDTAVGTSVGLARAGEPLDCRADGSSRDHVEQLQPMIDELLWSRGITIHDLATIAVSTGPGPFTGMRIGIATARTLGMVAGIEVRGFGSLDALALDWFSGPDRPDGPVVVCTDARRKELYWATYDADGLRIDGPRVTSPDQLPPLPVAGPAAGLYSEVLGDRAVAAVAEYVDTALVASRLAELPDTGLEPQYLRKPDAVEPRTRKSALGTGQRLRLPKLQEKS
ncbi:MAG: tRNA (adenosine(37)-N6)-threonylcarbamoyltransferase complex dimerization subunit type 1 TsaB [Brooklawnia sp.]|jgi:tRNA threonylcarbamoyl adenosine modification protein YeaZ